MPIPLGPFLLHHRLGVGGMGEVWWAVHRLERVPVAVKVLLGAEAHRPAFRKAFQEEVQAVARLQHPGIVWLHDWGETDDATVEASQGRLDAGLPYLAMELASGGSLDRQVRPRRWAPLRQLLLAVLDALAHAHARGVLHRDLKPGNILLATDLDPIPGWKLSDFGLARRLDSDEPGGLVSGTPRYMAPEQAEGRWRDFGPWTDLYALGALAWELFVGVAPLPDGPGRAGELPPFLPDHPLPEGLGAWLGQLLCPDHLGRFPSAADAASALLALPEPDEEEVGDAPTPGSAGGSLGSALGLRLGSGARTGTAGPTGLGLSAPSGLTQPHLDPLPAHEGERVVAPLLRLPFPPDWRSDRPPPPPALADAGLAVYPLRVAPLAGREAERDRLWAALGEVVAEQRPVGVLLEGPAGTGKTRLAAWLAERAHEVGAAQPLRVRHAASPGPGYGLYWMLRRALGAVGLPRHLAVGRALQALVPLGGGDEVEVLGLAELLVPATEGERPLLHTVEERHGVLLRLLGRMAWRRPLLLWVDDCQWGPDALRFVERLLDADLPALVVLTAQSEALALQPEAADRLRRLRPRLRTLPLGPLSAGEGARLVRGLLRLDDALAADLGVRSGGNPLFAVQLLQDWVERRVLVPGPGGFRLDPAASASLPDSLHAVWADRVTRIFSGPALLALEAAAALGVEVAEDEWLVVCEALGADRERCRSLLLQQGLAVPTMEGLAFVHGMLRESVERMGREAGRGPQVHSACADALSGRSDPGALVRRGPHLHAAGRLPEAVDALLDGVHAARRRDDYRTVRVLLELREETLDTLGAPPGDLRRAEGRLQRSKLAAQAGGDVMGALRIAEELVADGERHGWPPGVLAKAAFRAGDVERMRGNLPAAEAWFRRSLAEAERAGSGRHVAMALRSLGQVYILRGEYKRAHAWVDEALSRVAGGDDLLGEAMCHNALGDIARLRGDWGAARREFATALAIHEGIGNRTGVSLCRHGLAEIDRFEGRLEEAEAGYRETLQLDAAIGRDSMVVNLNLALCLIARGRPAEALARLEAPRVTWTRQGKPGYLACGLVAMLPCLAALGRWEEFDTTLGEARALLGRTGMVDPDVAWSAEQATALCEAAGEAERAAGPRAIAAAQRAALG